MFSFAGQAGASFGQGKFAHYAAHAGAGCLTAVAQGGKCGQGAVSAVASKFATLNMPDMGTVGNGIGTVIVGGTTSVIGGGKFANGAESALYGYLFNQGMSCSAGRSARCVAEMAQDQEHRRNAGNINSNLTTEQAAQANEVALEAAKLASAFHPVTRVLNTAHDGITVVGEVNKGNVNQGTAVGIGMAAELLIEKLTKGVSGALSAARTEIIERSAALQGWLIGKAAESSIDKTQVPCARGVSCR